MSRAKLWGSNILTALVTAVVTSLFWMIAYSNITLVDRKEGDEKDRASPPAPSPTGKISLGPSGLAVPVAGVAPAALSDTFTQARAGGARVHDAIDIMAPHGTPVVSAAPGQVEKLFDSKGGGGITAYVRSPDGKWSYYYAHLQSYAPGLREGQRLRRGDPIGLVGSTGNADPAGPHLHFAIHRMAPGDAWHEGAAINPYPLLAGQRAAR